MAEQSVPALMAPPIKRDNPLTRSVAGIIGMVFLAVMLLGCLLSLPYTLGREIGPGGEPGAPRYNAGDPKFGRLPPSWWPVGPREAVRLNGLVDEAVVAEIAKASGVTPAQLIEQTDTPGAARLRDHWVTRKHPGRYFLGSDVLGRSLLFRCLTGGGISIGIGIAAALISVLIGTLYGTIAGYAGGRVDGVMMRVVDILYGLPYILLVVLLAVASDAAMDEYVGRHKERQRWQVSAAMAEATARGMGQDRAAAEKLLAEDEGFRLKLETDGIREVPPREISEGKRRLFDVVVLLCAIGGVSWLTMARVIRGQVLSLKKLPFVEAARAIGVQPAGIFTRHLLPNLMGPIIVYTTLTVPQAILQESFLSFLGIGVKPPLPSWGNLAADGLSELNPYESNWWLLLFPCLLLGTTLLALNFVGEGLREAFDPKRSRR